MGHGRGGGAAGIGGTAMGAPIAPAHASINFSKGPFTEEVAPLKIGRICFGIMSKQDIVMASGLHVYKSMLYTMPERSPHP